MGGEPRQRGGSRNRIRSLLYTDGEVHRRPFVLGREKKKMKTTNLEGPESKKRWWEFYKESNDVPIYTRLNANKETSRRNVEMSFRILIIFETGRYRLTPLLSEK